MIFDSVPGKKKTATRVEHVFPLQLSLLEANGPGFKRNISH